MSTIRCKHCDQFLFSGFENEFGEQFCSIECYTLYCFDNHREINLDKLISIVELNESR